MAPIEKIPFKIAMASDHAGFEYKEKIKKALSYRMDFLDLGTDSLDSVDYPDFGRAMGKAITEGKAKMGIVICGSGIGISIAANRFPAVRAALCTSPEMARLARLHNDANVIAFGARVTDSETVLKCIDVFLRTQFEGGRHENRVKKLSGK